jgi:hypothetical protein
MNRRSIFSISAMTVLGLALVPSSAGAQQKSLKDQLVGIWTLASIYDSAPDGTKKQLYANPKGILILDAGGRYALVQGEPNRPKIKGNRNGATAEELAAATRTFAANFGTWSVDEPNKSFIWRYEIALIPNNDGIEFRSAIGLAGDELTLTENRATGGRSDSDFVRVYRRAK